MTTADAGNPLLHGRYQRSNAYPHEWVTENEMGPNALWLVESLTEVMPITAGVKVLDLGCGRAMTSIFLAREFGARVWATDLWIDASENQRRIVEAGVDDLVTPIHAEAHTLPFGHEFFDAIVSLDAYHYFGTDDLYLGYAVEFLKAGGRIGVVAPSLLQDPEEVPPQLEPFWEWEFWSFHSPRWWARHWDKTGKVRIDHADAVEDGWRDWLRFTDITAPLLTGWRAEGAVRERAMLEVDGGEHLGFVRIVATKI